MAVIDIDDNNEEGNEEGGEENGSDNEIITPGVFFSRPGGKPAGKDKVHRNDTPIDNADDVPLFEDADKRGLRTVQYIKVVKLNNPRAGYKGDIPKGSTLRTIAELFGDGIYTLEACNAAHRTIRTRENVRISMEDSTSTQVVKQGGGGTDINDVIRELNKQHEANIARVLESATSSAKESVANSDKFIDLVKTQAEGTIERDRLFMGDMTKNQQGFFASMMAMQNQGFQQMMMLMMASNNHTIQALKTVYEGGNKGTDIDILLKGVMLAQGLGGNDDPDWLKALDKGGSMMKSLLALKQSTETPTQPSSEPNPNKKETKNKNKQHIISKDELLEIVRLKKLLNRRGIDFGEMVRHTREQLVDQEIDAENEDDNIEESSESESSPSKPDNNENQTE